MTREEAITRLKNMAWLYGSVEREQNIEAIDMAIEALSEQKTGEWVKSDILPNGWHCSNCDAPVMTDDIDEMLYCPNCGARMKGESHE